MNCIIAFILGGILGIGFVIFAYFKSSNDDIDDISYVRYDD